MNLALEQSWREIFALAAEAKAEKRHKEEMTFLVETLDREEHDRREVRKRDEKVAKAIEEMAATAEQIAAFDARLDKYDANTVDALMDNGERLDRLHDELRRMSENAYMLPDGRRVFKTEDGRRVFDERGAEVAAKTIDPQMIEDRHTRWETYKAGKDAESKLETERYGLLEFQTKLDDARARADKGNISKTELDALGADLDANAPPAVGRRLGMTTPADDRAKSRPDEPLPANPPTVTDDVARRVQARPAPM